MWTGVASEKHTGRQHSQGQGQGGAEAKNGLGERPGGRRQMRRGTSGGREGGAIELPEEKRPGFRSLHTADREEREKGKDSGKRGGEEGLGCSEGPCAAALQTHQMPPGVPDPV